MRSGSFGKTSVRPLGAGGRLVSGTFVGTENPLSESGAWLNGQADGVDWGNFKKASGVAVGTRASDFRDNTALYTGPWANNQYAKATVYKGTVDNSFFPEAEVRLRSNVSANVLTGYEVFASLRGGANSYLGIALWKGSWADFSYLFNDTGSTYEILHGGVLSATIVGNILTAYINNVQKAQVDITQGNGAALQWASGKPGIGTNCNTGGDSFLDQYGFSAYEFGDL